MAGLRAAIALAQSGKVLVLAKQELTESATQYAQGGIAVALSDEDEIGLHLQDTIQAGDGIVNPDAARILVEEGPDRIQELIEWGTQFDRNGSRLTFTREAAHSRSRVLHAHGDSTGREIGSSLYAKAATLPNVFFSEFEFTSGLHVEDGRICGVQASDPNGQCDVIRSAAVLLATGGAGQIYADTTNPGVATGDGIAMAYRAGAEISDVEFVQFHPTALYIPGAPRFLLSEALRGEGAILRNAERQRFMPKYHDMAELAPRDVVARAIAHELELSRLPDPVVYLDMTHLDGANLAARFPRIHQTCLKHNVDITRDLVPIRPAAHYIMGGVRTDLAGRSNLPGLYAAGEAACTGVHGANRLASNSLLEGLVFGARAGAAMREDVKSAAKPSLHPPKDNHPDDASAISSHLDAPVSPLDPNNLIQEVQRLMWSKVGVVRTEPGLREAHERLQSLAASLPAATSRRGCEALNIHTTATLIVRAALARLESRGAHYRTDFPAHDDLRFKKHSIIRGNGISFQ